MTRDALRAGLAVTLIWALAWSALAVAAARGSGAGTQVICIGAGVVLAPLDPRGRPPEACPDGVLGFAAADAVPPIARPPVRRASASEATPPGEPRDALPGPAPQARGPPLRA